MARGAERVRLTSVAKPTPATAVPAQGHRPAVAAALALLDAFLAARLADARDAPGVCAAAPAGERVAARLRETLLGDERWQRVIDSQGLDAFQTMALLLALAPDIDLRYQPLFASLQDDFTRRRPTLDCLLKLCAVNDGEREARRAEFSEGGRLLARGLVTLGSDSVGVRAPHGASFVVPDELIVAWLVAGAEVDARLAPFVTLLSPARHERPDVATPTEWRDALAAVRGGAPVWLQGVPGNGEQACASFIASALGRRLLIFDCCHEPEDARAVPLRLALRAASLNDACLWVVDSGGLSEKVDCAPVFATDVPVMFSSRRPPVPALRGAARRIELLLPDAGRRAGEWRGALAARGFASDETLVRQLANRFRVTPAQIQAAARLALDGSRMELFAAARAQCVHRLGEVAQRIVPCATWADLVLPEDALQQLRELCDRVDTNERVFDEWGFAARQTRGRGVSALFGGPSGTGKTMAAEVVANALGLELYRVDLARVVSKYIGETEKNLERVFAAAADANAIIFFDEADALFGKRSEVKDAHDRHANIEVAYLLQRMEDHDGVAILATNLADHIDRAFTRRLSFFVQFPFPDVEYRRRLWRRAWPDRVPTEGIDCDALAQQFRITGGSIRNVALAASFLAARDSGVVRMSHVMHALRREHQKLGTSAANDQRLALAEVPHGRG
jgi:ATP-dependent 26S proteasome regulatory subunit